MEHYSFDFEFLLVLNHDDVTWDCPKREDMGKRRIIFRHNFGKIVKRTISIL
jgi:hypothetical protein